MAIRPDWSAGVTHPDPDGGGSLAAPVTEYAYSGTTSLLTEHEDPLNYDTTYAYNATSRRLSSITHPDTSDWLLTPLQTSGLASDTIPCVL